MLTDQAAIAATLNTTYVDLALVPTAGHDVVAGSVSGSDLVLSAGAGPTVSGSAPTRLTGTDIYRFYVTGDFAAGDVTVGMLSGAWNDTGGASAAGGGTFTVIETRAEVVAPFGPDGTLDIDVANGDLDGGIHYVDVNFALPSGAELDYDSVLDTTPEIAISGSGLAGAVARRGPAAAGRADRRRGRGPPRPTSSRSPTRPGT